MSIKPLPGQPSLFEAAATTADEAQAAAAARPKPRPGSPREWIERTESGLCGVCGVNAREVQPDAYKTILQSTSDQYCRGCFQEAVQALAKRGITRQEE